MILEDGNFFVISDAEQVEVLDDGTKFINPPRFEGIIFEAKKVEDDNVLAKILEIGQSDASKDVLISLNLKNYNIETVSKAYAHLYLESREPDVGVFGKPIGSDEPNADPAEPDQGLEDFLKNTLSADDIFFEDDDEDIEDEGDPDGEWPGPDWKDN